MNYELGIRNQGSRYYIKFLVVFLFLIFCFLFFAPVAHADLSGNHNIDTNNDGYYWAWNDVVGWINFHANQTVEVRTDELRGWAGSNLGPIVLNCLTSPAGDICGGSDFKVANNQGVLSGWAWNDKVGWISFDGGNYGVTIQPAGDGASSFFKGWAWNDVVGWISFHCENQDLCSVFPTYRIQTAAGSRAVAGTVESNVFDTGSAAPAYNYAMWKGIPKTGGLTQIQLASSNDAAGPWIFDLAVAAAVNQKISVGGVHQGKRYIKYRLTISTDTWGGNSPVVEGVIMNYSP